MQPHDPGQLRWPGLFLCSAANIREAPRRSVVLRGFGLVMIPVHLLFRHTGVSRDRTGGNMPIDHNTIQLRTSRGEASVDAVVSKDNLSLGAALHALGQWEIWERTALAVCVILAVIALATSPQMSPVASPEPVLSVARPTQTNPSEGIVVEDDLFQMHREFTHTAPPPANALTSVSALGVKESL